MNYKVYIWNQVSAVSDNYHPEGGVVIIAPSLDRARKLGEETFAGMKINTKPSFSVPCSATEEKIYVFPNAGCC